MRRRPRGKAAKTPCSNYWPRSVPFNFGPALKIDGTNARLVVDALSGRRSYHNERKDRRDIYHHVANAFSLALSKIVRKRQTVSANRSASIQNSTVPDAACGYEQR